MRAFPKCTHCVWSPKSIKTSNILLLNRKAFYPCCVLIFYVHQKLTDHCKVQHQQENIYTTWLNKILIQPWYHDRSGSGGRDAVPSEKKLKNKNIFFWDMTPKFSIHPPLFTNARNFFVSIEIQNVIQYEIQSTYAY